VVVLFIDARFTLKRRTLSFSVGPSLPASDAGSSLVSSTEEGRVDRFTDGLTERLTERLTDGLAERLT